MTTGVAALSLDRSARRRLDPRAGHSGRHVGGLAPPRAGRHRAGTPGSPRRLPAHSSRSALLHRRHRHLASRLLAAARLPRRGTTAPAQAGRRMDSSNPSLLSTGKPAARQRVYPKILWLRDSTDQDRRLARLDAGVGESPRAAGTGAAREADTGVRGTSSTTPCQLGRRKQRGLRLGGTTASIGRRTRAERAGQGSQVRGRGELGRGAFGDLGQAIVRSGTRGRAGSAERQRASLTRRRSGHR